ncbi:muscle M-line assembly protein unc-89 [Cocos nucifera]|uniref:Muscle M-line assembly protein unc-89 n=1 Tax=Cocos nucifera TaxID=13894 RepID=A0A8K0IAR5_COCNU|nr:muscle M-line assembly protein unc-89 [Cocos nucifera]
MGLHQRVEEDYDEEEYDEYEEEASEPGEEHEPEAPKMTMEEQEFLKLREQLKEKFRQKMKKQSANASSHLFQSQDKKRTVASNKFGSFFGPSQPVIAPRVIEESRSIRETKHIVSKNKRDLTSSETTTYVYRQKPTVVNEVKKKAQTLKDMRDYSFLLSDDADLPVSEEKKPPPPRSRILIQASANVEDGWSAQTPSSRIPTSKPVRPASDGSELKKASTNRHMQIKVGSVKEAPVSRIRPPSTESRKVLGGGCGNGSIQTTMVISTGNKALSSKIPAQNMGTNRPPMKATSDPSLKNLSSTKVRSSAQNHHLGRKKMSQGPDNPITVPKQPLPSSKVQPSKQILSRGIHDDCSKRRPAKRDLDEEEDIDDVRGLIRKMFRYDPSKYSGNDEDDSDMEVGFDRIQKEELISSKIARREDEEELRLIEQEEREERRRKMMRKKQRYACESAVHFLPGLKEKPLVTGSQ